MSCTSNKEYEKLIRLDLMKTLQVELFFSHVFIKVFITEIRYYKMLLDCLPRPADKLLS